MILITWFVVVYVFAVVLLLLCSCCCVVAAILLLNIHLFSTFCRDCQNVWDPCCNSHHVDCTSHLLHDDDRGIDRSSVCCRIRSLSSLLHVDTAVVVVGYDLCLEENLETEEWPLPQQRPLLWLQPVHLSLALHEPLQWLPSHISSNSTTGPQTRPLPSHPESRQGPTVPAAGPPPLLEEVHQLRW